VTSSVIRCCVASLWALVVIVVACAEVPRGLLSSVPSPPQQVQRDCALATTRCTHCHPIDRIVVTRGVGERRWQMLVDQMRLKPSSGISPAEAAIIFRCLRYVDEACTDCKRGRS
jgi:hypothetical protein